MSCRFIVKPYRVVINTVLSENIHKSLIKDFKTTNTKEICKAFHGLPGPKSRLFMGCQAAELNHFAKPFKMDLQLTNRRFNFDKFRVCIRLTCQTFGGSCQDYLDRSGLLDKAC